MPKVVHVCALTTTTFVHRTPFCLVSEKSPSSWLFVSYVGSHAPFSSKVEFSRVETGSKFPTISLFSIEHMQMRHGTGRKQVRGVVQPPSRGFMMRFFLKMRRGTSLLPFYDAFFSKRGKSIPRCYTLFSFLLTLFGVVATENF